MEVVGTAAARVEEIALLKTRTSGAAGTTVAARTRRDGEK